MILRSIKLENIRSYLHEKIEFSEGSVLLSGDIGSGKSTILYAIEFALFGIMRAELSGSSLLRHGKNNGSVELKFEIGDNEYIVMRALKRSKDSVVQDSGYLLVNGRKFEGTPVELKAKIIEILGYPEALISRSKSLIYRYTVYTPQEEMKQILFEDKDVRLDTLRKVFGIDKYKIIKENAILSLREIKRKQSELKIRLENESELLAEKKEKQEHYNRLSSQLSDLDESLNNVKEKADAEKKNLDKLDDKIKEYNEIKKSLEVKQAQLREKNTVRHSMLEKIQAKKEKIEQLESRLKQYSEVKELKEEKPLEKDISEKEDRLAESIKLRSSSTEKLKYIENQIASKEREIKEISQLSKKMFEMKEELDLMQKKLEKKHLQNDLLERYREKENSQKVLLDKIAYRISQSENAILNIRDADICPTCSQKVDIDHKKLVITREKKNIERFKSDKKEAEKIMGSVSASLEKIKNNLDVLARLEEKYRSQREELARLENSSSKLVDMQKEISRLYAEKKQANEEFEKKGLEKEETLKNSLDTLKKKLAEARENNIRLREKMNITDLIVSEKDSFASLLGEMGAAAKEIEEAQGKLKKLESRLSEFRNLESTHNALKKTYEEISEKQKQLEIDMARLKQEIKSTMLNIAQIDKKLFEMGKTKEKIKELSEIITWTDEFFINLIETMEKHIMASIHKEFNSLLREWFSLLIDDIEITLDHEFTPEISIDGYNTSIESLSGGEKTSVALAYRLALNKVINDLISIIRTKDLIILDEPTDGFSSEQLDKVRDVLEELSMRQTIIVSHEPKMESFVENIIRISKSDGVSRVV
ncbi:SMC family ATPase [Candidatus Woesearchaeota archaeon]|nr:SMC family ATPase [Candidatus Woesearchaeota archaeon]